MCHIFFLSSSRHEYLRCFQYWDNKHGSTEVSLKIWFNFLWINSSVNVEDRHAVLISWGASTLFSILATAVTIALYGWLWSWYLCQHLFPFIFIMSSLWRLAWYFTVVLIHPFLMMKWYWIPFHVPVGHLHVFLWEWLFRYTVHLSLGYLLFQLVRWMHWFLTQELQDPYNGKC